MNRRLDQTVRYPVQHTNPTRQRGIDTSPTRERGTENSPTPEQGPDINTACEPVEHTNPKRQRGPVPRKHRNIKVRDIIKHEAHALANALIGKRDIPFVIQTRNLWSEPDATADPAAHAARVPAEDGDFQEHAAHVQTEDAATQSAEPEEQSDPVEDEPLTPDL